MNTDTLLLIEIYNKIKELINESGFSTGDKKETWEQVYQRILPVNPRLASILLRLKNEFDAVP